MRGAGINPDIERVAAARERLGGGPARGQCDAREDFGGGGVVPEIGAFTGNLRRDRAGDAGVEKSVFLIVKKGRNGHAPRALAADAPIGPRFDGTADAGFAPTGNPLNVFDGGEGGGAGVGFVEGNKPLVDGAENNRGL